MIFGISTFACYMYIASGFDNLSLSEGKNWLLIMPILFLLAILEVYGEIKWGARNVFKFVWKGLKLSYIKIRLFKIKRKLRKHYDLKEKELIFLKKYGGKKWQ